MRTFLIILFIFSSSQILWAQDTLCRDSKLSLSIHPLALADIFDGSSLRLSTELKLFRNVAFSIEGGGYLNLSGKFLTKDDAQGFLLKPGIKIYLNSNGLTAGKNISAELLYKKQSYSYQDSIVLNGDPPFYKNYKMRREITGINIKYGESAFANAKRFIIEWYAGAGIRIVNSSSNLTPEEEEGRLKGENHGADSGAAVRWTGKSVYPVITVGFKLGWKLL